MTFDALLAQIIELLQRQGRVSYGALKRRFSLDDAYLEDLKTELIEYVLAAPGGEISRRRRLRRAPQWPRQFGGVECPLLCWHP
jgi:hypothetical protein